MVVVFPWDVRDRLKKFSFIKMQIQTLHGCLCVSTKLNSSLAKYLFFTKGFLLVWCWGRTSFHFCVQLLLSKNPWRCWTQQLFCGGNDLHLLVAAAASCFSLGLLGSDRLLKAQKCKDKGLEHLSLLHLLAGASFWLFVPDGRLWVSTMCCAQSEWCLCTGSCWLSWWGAHVWISLESCCCFLSGMAGNSFWHF